jgi:hypothetical protein
MTIHCAGGPVFLLFGVPKTMSYWRRRKRSWQDCQEANTTQVRRRRVPHGWHFSIFSLVVSLPLRLSKAMRATGAPSVPVLDLIGLVERFTVTDRAGTSSIPTGLTP